MGAAVINLHLPPTLFEEACIAVAYMFRKRILKECGGISFSNFFDIFWG